MEGQNWGQHTAITPTVEKLSLGKELQNMSKKKKMEEQRANLKEISNTKVGDESKTQKCLMQLGWSEPQLGLVCLIPLIFTK